MSSADADFREPHLRSGDFLGAFAVIEQDQRILMVQNQRRIGGVAVATWDLPGGQVEPGELLHEALARELREETGLSVARAHFLFVQEGERVTAGRRDHAWRSFFFAVEPLPGEAQAQGEVTGLRWFDRRELARVLHAPYHDSFRDWLQGGGAFFRSRWRE
jgi:8-oxo-dGTP diphosphatase